MNADKGHPAIARSYIVRGRVQGVGFRWFVDHEARQLGLAGWVRNNFDGSVEVLACGAPGNIERLRRWLDDGPPMARVERVASEPADPTAAPAGFVTG